MIGQKARAAALGFVFTAVSGVVAAQSQFDWAGKQGDWDVFHTGEGGSRVCWIVSEPSRSTARRGNSTVSVNRGSMYLMVAVRPAQNVRNEVSTVIGYTFQNNSTVRVDIGNANFTMFTDGDKAWLENAAADDRVAEAMRRGAEATVTGVSSRGTTTIDTYSLSGFTAALNEAQRLCS
jgi:invasion protein IalB